MKYLSLQFRALKNTQKSLPLKLNALLLLELEKSTNRSLNFKNRHTQTQKKSTQMYAYVEIIQQRVVN